ncbi:MAG: hypothetical protein AAGD22_16615 [Verrucomicrobiota bacterium]
MNTEEAKRILGGSGPDHRDLNDSLYAEAMKLAETDPELAAWLEREWAFDQDMASAFRDMEVPDGLADAIVSGVCSFDEGDAQELVRDESSVVLIGEEPPVANGKIVSIGHFKRRLWMVAAVLVAGAFLTVFFLFPPAVKFPEDDFSSIDVFRDHMALFANSRFVLDYSTKDLGEAREWLRDRGAPVYDSTPAAIAAYRAMGCKTFDWGGKAVSLVCFVNGHGDLVHLFLLERGAMGDLESGELSLPEVAVRRDLETGGWSDADFVYLLVGSEPGVDVEEILASSGVELTS